MSLTYEKYLHLDQLLEQQAVLSDPAEHDELLFIIVHQVYELWFKQIKHELAAMQYHLRDGDITAVTDGFKRVITIVKTLVSQLDILETMTPVSFNSFREKLQTASGLQSVQFREIEFMLGKKDARVILRFQDNPAARENLTRLLDQPSLWLRFLRYLGGQGISLPRQVMERDVQLATAESEEVQQALIEIYKTRSPLMPLCERFVDLDEGLQEWRYRHFKMVQRTIGTKMGTGNLGSPYLLAGLNTPLFPDLWTIRTSL